MQSHTRTLDDPRETLLLRLLNSELTEEEIAFELRGSLGFMCDVKARVSRVLDLQTEDELQLFAAKWCEANPYPKQHDLEVVKPHPYLIEFAVVKNMVSTSSTRYRIYLGRPLKEVTYQRGLLERYVEAVKSQVLESNFTGGSFINGKPTPGWSSLQKLWPRRIAFTQLILGNSETVAASENECVVELSYSARSKELVQAMSLWLDSQFALHGAYRFEHMASAGLVRLEEAPRLIRMNESID